MAFESLSDRFQGILKKIKGQAKLTEANMEEMLKEAGVVYHMIGDAATVGTLKEAISTAYQTAKNI